MKLSVLFSTIIASLSASCFAQETHETLFWTTPNLVFDDQHFSMNFHFQTEYQASSGKLYTIEADPSSTDLSSGKTQLLVTYEVPSPQVPYGPGMGRGRLSFPPLAPGKYEVSIKHEFPQITETFNFQVLDKQHRGFRKINHETPAKGELVSGIGLIRGWACQEQGKIGDISYQIDDSEILSGSKKLKIPYGSARYDTAAVCSNDGEGGGAVDWHNGYGSIINWNALSPGEHRFRLWVDGHLASDHVFTVAKAKAEFLTDLSKELTLDNFPYNGNSSRLRWSEADQNFILIETQQ